MVRGSGKRVWFTRARYAVASTRLRILRLLSKTSGIENPISKRPNATVVAIAAIRGPYGSTTPGMDARVHRQFL